MEINQVSVRLLDEKEMNSMILVNHADCPESLEKKLCEVIEYLTDQDDENHEKNMKDLCTLFNRKFSVECPDGLANYGLQLKMKRDDMPAIYEYLKSLCYEKYRKEIESSSSESTNDSSDTMEVVTSEEEEDLKNLLLIPDIDTIEELYNQIQDIDLTDLLACEPY